MKRLLTQFLSRLCLLLVRDNAAQECASLPCGHSVLAATSVPSRVLSSRCELALVPPQTTAPWSQPCLNLGEPPWLPGPQAQSQRRRCSRVTSRRPVPGWDMDECPRAQCSASPVPSSSQSPQRTPSVLTTQPQVHEKKPAYRRKRSLRWFVSTSSRKRHDTSRQ